MPTRPDDLLPDARSRARADSGRGVDGGRLRGLHAVVTGASRGIGRSIAVAMAGEGARLTLIATGVAGLEETARQCAEPGGGPHRVQALDVTDRVGCFAAIDAASSAIGGADILVNAAGVFRPSPFLEYDGADFRSMLEVNLYGTIHLMQAVLPGMIERRFGRIVNIASTAGKWASSNQSAYNVSKHAVVGLTRCVALEMGQHGICVNAICPGLVETEMLQDGHGQTAKRQGKTLEEVLAPIVARAAMKRILQPEEIARLAVFLASPDASGMTGQSIVVDGGMLYI